MAKKKIPKQKHDVYVKFMVGKQEWTILSTAFPLMGVHGYTDWDKQFILLDGTEDADTFLDTYLHEVSHAIDPNDSEGKVKKRGNVLSAALKALHSKNIKPKK